MRYIQRSLVYLSIIMGVIGSAVGVFSVGPIHIFPYRILISLLWLFFVGEVAVKYGKICAAYIRGVKTYLLFLVFWLFYAIFSVLWALDRMAAVKQIVFLFMGVSVIFFVVYFLRNEKDLWDLYRIWLFVVVVLLPIGLWEVWTGKHLKVSNLYGYQPESIVRQYKVFMPSTVFYNPNDFAFFLVLSIPFVFMWIKYTKKKPLQIIGGILLLIMIYLLLMTYSRASYIAIILELVFFFVFLLKFKHKIRFITAIVGGSLPVIVLYYQQIKQFVDLFIEQIFSLTSKYSLTTGSVFVRINLIKNALFFLWKTAGFGVGAGNVEYWMRNFSLYNTRGILNLHNWWIEILTNYGVVIFVGYVIFYLSLLRGLYKIYINEREADIRMISGALLLSLVGFSIASISSSSIMSLRPQWFLFAFALAFVNYEKTKDL